MKTLTIVIFGGGVILLYAGLKDKDPKSVITSALKGQSPSGAGSVGNKPVPLHPAAQEIANRNAGHTGGLQP